MFGDRLKYLRNSRGLTIEALAHRLDVAYSTIGMYEGHKRRPNITMLSKIADFFNVSIDYLVERTDIPDPLVSNLDSKYLEVIADAKSLNISPQELKDLIRSAKKSK